jgi:hypothetical protein
MKFFAGLLVAFAGAVALASEPGQPLDCSDWVFHESGLTCAVWHPWTIWEEPFPPNGDPRTYLDEFSTFDMAQRMIRVRKILVPPPPGCLYTSAMPQLEISWWDGTNEGVIAHLPPRCNIEQLEWADDPSNIEFDPNSGTLLLGVADVVGCWNGSENCSPWSAGWWVAAIHGFTTTFEVLETYTPSSQQTRFRGLREVKP